MMRLFPLLFLLLLTGCSLTIHPKPVDSDAIVNPADRSISLVRDQLGLTVRVQEAAVGGFTLEKPIVSFYVEASNRGSLARTLPPSAFELRDSTGRSYPPVAPETVHALLHPLPGYLVPFPFVGYLDVTGLESYRAGSAMASAGPYVGQGLPAGRDSSGAFDGSMLAPGSRVAGLIYFELDLYQVDSVVLQVLPPGSTRPVVFPFQIER